MAIDKGKGVDYQETFALVDKMVIVKALLAAAMHNLEVYQMDVSNAFLHGDLFEDVYMKLPMGYTGVGEAVQDIERSNKSFGYVQSKFDYSLFTKKDGDSFTAVLVYVDDLMITGAHATEIQHLKSQLSSHFYMKDLVLQSSLLLIVILIGQAAIELEDVSQVIVFFLGNLIFLESLKSKEFSQDHSLKQNVEPWP
uniref:Retrovirus-related Pol polyprotein from transposon TNT 1-94 n=1 Tax=Tanacetum cinerariifolium TaxID=118510 RepID=A0A699HA63_TANCI|nr:retrovirus-related Pol polyprotein from transposon TNT 1-94 [Tanacetum cinerariifolium]